ncbi:MAG TPA: PEP/pyruvate-binding domain-containing protein, partial [Myxococcaceae bacterium]|nr:PEP/pyruvate-binding domain-containing protein [Myxococcaceae bacterium]
MTTPTRRRVQTASPRRSAIRGKRGGPATRSRTLVFHFDQLPEVKRTARTWDEVKTLLGGKGANLAEMTRLGLPVPPGFTVTTEACRAFLRTGGWPRGLWEQEVAALRELERRTGKRFGDPSSPLLVSCRSGAKFSMPGMMDTVLNIGLNAATVEGLARLTEDPRFAWDAYRRLIQMYGTVVLGVRDEPFEHVLAEWRARRGVENDADLGAE